MPPFRSPPPRETTIEEGPKMPIHGRPVEPLASRATAPVLALAVSFLLASCGSSSTRESERGRIVRSVTVPLQWTADAERLPEELRLAEGDEIVRQTYSIELDGKFRFNRSIQRRVASMGASGRDLDAKRAEKLGVSAQAGVVIQRVRDDSPASIAGLRPDDVIVRLGETPVTSARQLEQLVESMPPGAPVEIEVQRGAETGRHTVELGETTKLVSGNALERELPVLQDISRTGIVLVELSDEVRPLVLGRDAPPGGLLVVGMLVGGPAFFSDLRHRDLIVEVNGEPVNSIDDWLTVMEEPRRTSSSVEVRALRGRGEILGSLDVVEDAQEDFEFSLAGLVSYKWSPTRRHFGLLWSLLFGSSTTYEIAEIGELTEHRRTFQWSLPLRLVYWKSDHSERTLGLLWIFPITVKRG